MPKTPTYKPSPAEVLLYQIFQEHRNISFSMRDNDCEKCGFGAMAARVTTHDYEPPLAKEEHGLKSITISICATCGHAQELKSNE